MPQELGNWYYSIETEPGAWTKGRDPDNIALTRDVLSRCAVEKAVCLDVGTMDGLVPVLLRRRGAAKVVACDRYDRKEYIAVVQRKLKLKFTYVPGVSLREFRERAPKLTSDPFDLIVFSGVLYHMYDPMTGLALMRAMARTGGIVVLETSAVLSKRPVGYFNVCASLVPDQHNYWNMSVELLDYLLRFFQLKALDCRYFEAGGVADDGSKVIRICVPCEAVSENLLAPDDMMNYAWMPASFRGGRNGGAGFRNGGLCPFIAAQPKACHATRRARLIFMPPRCLPSHSNTISHDAGSR